VLHWAEQGEVPDIVATREVRRRPLGQVCQMDTFFRLGGS
jgi:hypothetical protein